MQLAPAHGTKNKTYSLQCIRCQSTRGRHCAFSLCQVRLLAERSERDAKVMRMKTRRAALEVRRQALQEQRARVHAVAPAYDAERTQAVEGDDGSRTTGGKAGPAEEGDNTLQEEEVVSEWRRRLMLF